MSDRATELSKLFDERLPINRKERYYTGTVLPMIVASDGFKHFGRFLSLCGVPEVAVQADPASSNIQFFTEYGFKESLMDGAEARFHDPDGKGTPDLVVYVESEQSLLLSVEAKVFDRPSRADVRKQLETQAELLRIMREGVGTNPSIHQVALLPAGLGMPEQDIGVPVLTWERVAGEFECVAPPYWIGVLKAALSRYDNLASQPGGRQNCDAKIKGEKIYHLHKKGYPTYIWMGRSGGLDGQEIQRDLRTGQWRTREYEVSRISLKGKRNWFPIVDFIRLLVDQPPPD